MGDIIKLNRYKTDGMSGEALEKYFENVLETQGWGSPDMNGELRYIEKKMPNGFTYGFTISKDYGKAIENIDQKYREYIANESRKILINSAGKGAKMSDVATENYAVLNSLRKLRNAFLPHDLTTPEWVNDFVGYAHATGIETFCVKEGNSYTVLCSLPGLDYSMDFRGEGPEEMALSVDYKVDAFSDSRFYRFCIEQNPGLDDYKTLSRAKQLKQKLQQFREVVLKNFLEENNT